MIAHMFSYFLLFQTKNDSCNYSMSVLTLVVKNAVNLKVVTPVYQTVNVVLRW